MSPCRCCAAVYFAPGVRLSSADHNAMLILLRCHHLITMSVIGVTLLVCLLRVFLSIVLELLVQRQLLDQVRATLDDFYLRPFQCYIYKTAACTAACDQWNACKYNTPLCGHVVALMLILLVTLFIPYVR